ncbi:MAG TPA: hypothetical protein VGF13_19400, partial [Verrucomicrobiae bacterium]
MLPPSIDIDGSEGDGESPQKAISVREGLASEEDIVKRMLLWALMVIPSFAEAVTYYVSRTLGDNANPGTEAQPFRDIQKFNGPNGLQLNPGDVVLFHCGERWIGTEAEWNITKSTGTSLRHIRFGMYGAAVNADGTPALPCFVGATLNTNMTWTRYGSTEIYYATGLAVQSDGVFHVENFGTANEAITPFWVHSTSRPLGTTLSQVLIRMSGTGQPPAQVTDHRGTCVSAWTGSNWTTYVRTLDGTSPTSPSNFGRIFLAQRPFSHDRGLVCFRTNGGGKYIEFENLRVIMSRARGFSSSDAFVTFSNCVSEFTVNDGFYFFKYGAVNSTDIRATRPNTADSVAGEFPNYQGAESNSLVSCTVRYAGLQGGGKGQSITTEAPGSTFLNCLVELSGWAGIDFLDYGIGSGGPLQGMTEVYNGLVKGCIIRRSSGSIGPENSDAGIYIDGGHDIRIDQTTIIEVGNFQVNRRYRHHVAYDAYANGIITPAWTVQKYNNPGIAIDTEGTSSSGPYGDGRRARNIVIQECLLGYNRGEAIMLGRNQGSQGEPLANVTVVNCTLIRAQSDTIAESFFGTTVRTVFLRARDITFKNNIVITSPVTTPASDVNPKAAVYYALFQEDGAAQSPLETLKTDNNIFFHPTAASLRGSSEFAERWQNAKTTWVE